MKLLLLVIYLFPIQSIAKTFDCYIYKNYFISQTALIQTSFAGNDPEENSEEYELLNYNNEVNAYVSFLPYQHGIDLYIDSKDKKIKANSTYDVNSNYVQLNLTLSKTMYSLSCARLEHF